MKKFSLKTKERSHPISKNKGILLIIGLLVGGALLMPSIIHMAGATVLYPIHLTRIWLQESSSSLPTYLREKQALSDEIDDLTRQLAEASGVHMRLSRAQNENRELRALLDMPIEHKRIAGRIIARPDELPYDVLQIDIGAQDNVKVGVPVYFGQKHVLGFVSHVASRYSLVSLVTSPEQQATAFVFGPDIYARTQGVGGGVLRVRIPQGVEVAEGDLVVLPAVAEGYYGEITHIETRPTEPQQYAYVPLPVSLQSLRYITVGTEPIQPVSFAEVEERIKTASSTLFMIDVPAEQLLETSTTSPRDNDTDDIELIPSSATGTGMLP